MLKEGRLHVATPLPSDLPAKAWGARERLQALNESHALVGDALHAWCREKGVYAHQLQTWRDAFCATGERSAKQDLSLLRELQGKHDQLERQLRRKDKALAQAAALLILQKFQALWADERMMNSTLQRQILLPLIEQAIADGARLQQASTPEWSGMLGTVQRWQHRCAQDGDRRVSTLRVHTISPNQLTQAERDAAMSLLNSEEFKDLPPSQIVPRLADQGQYVASEATMYRLLHSAHQMGHRRLERVPRKVSKPRALVATQPDQIYCWDITYLPAPVRGMHFYLYLFVDIFSRKIVGWQVFDCESAELAAGLLRDICERQSIPEGQLTVHSDNGSPMKGETMLATMQRLGVAHSRSRPSVSNDNPLTQNPYLER